MKYVLKNKSAAHSKIYSRLRLNNFSLKLWNIVWQKYKCKILRQKNKKWFNLNSASSTMEVSDPYALTVITE